MYGGKFFFFAKVKWLNVQPGLGRIKEHVKYQVATGHLKVWKYITEEKGKLKEVRDTKWSHAEGRIQGEIDGEKRREGASHLEETDSDSDVRKEAENYLQTAS